MKSDFRFVFKDIMDLDHFERDMFFSDPISKFTFFRGEPALPFLERSRPVVHFPKRLRWRRSSARPRCLHQQNLMSCRHVQGTNSTANSYATSLRRSLRSMRSGRQGNMKSW